MKIILKLSYILIPVSLVLTIIYLLLVMAPINHQDNTLDLISNLFSIAQWLFILGLLSWIITKKKQVELTERQKKTRFISIIIFIVLIILISVVPFLIFFLI